MQEIKKKKIVLASVLKPVDDTRMYLKFARTLSGPFEVHCIGFPSRSVPQFPPIKLHALPRFKRLSLTRLLIPWIIFRWWWRLKPDVVIITTHELLFAALLAKYTLRCRVIYDIQENYFRNLWHTPAFAPVIRFIVAGYVRAKEKLCASCIDHFILAEEAYTRELRFLRQARTTVIENKAIFIPSESPPKSDSSIRLLFSGTLAETTGVFKAIEWANALHALEPTIELHIVGYCALERERKRLHQCIRNTSFIHSVGIDHLVPYPQIAEAIARAHFGIIAYPPNPSTGSARPTKLFEYLGYQLPILLVNNPVWVALAKKYNAAVVLPYDGALDFRSTLREMRSTSFYTSKPAEVWWETEEPKLRAVLHAVISV